MSDKNVRILPNILPIHFDNF